jgi:phage I-like protein
MAGCKAWKRRADGLYGQVKWSEEGKKMVENGHYKFFSPYWGAEEIGRLNSTKLVRPVELVSVGLTNEPNIPVLPLSNTKDKNMELLATLIALLKLENDANEEKVTNRIKELQTSAERVTTLENDKKKAEHDDLGG